MAIPQSDVLSPQVLTELQELIQVNIDSRDGYRHAAKATSDLNLQSAFEEIARNRDNMAEELASYVAWSGEMPVREGSFLEAIRETWLSIREALSADNRHTILQDAERAEDAIRYAYEKALENTLGSDVNSVLLRQYSDVEMWHSRIRDLRDAYSNS